MSGQSHPFDVFFAICDAMGHRVRQRKHIWTQFTGGGKWITPFLELAVEWLGEIIATGNQTGSRYETRHPTTRRERPSTRVAAADLS